MHLKQLGGVTSFRRYMDLALNDPNDGFYGSGQARVSRDGDFVTSPALGSDFAGLLASQVVRWLAELPADLPTLSLIEIGPGEGDLLADLVDAIADQSPQMLHRLELVLVEANPGMKQRQQERLQHKTNIPMRWPTHRNIGFVLQAFLLPLLHPWIGLHKHQFEAMQHLG